MIGKTIHFVITLLLVTAIGVWGIISHADEVTTQNHCSKCHNFIEGETPADHPDVLGPEDKLCVKIKIIFEDISDGKFLASPHTNNNVSCSDCHEENIFELDAEIENDTCFSCHESYEALAELTKNIVVAEQNPHKSHLGEMDCTVCHHVHSRSSAYCLQCHSNFTMPIPGAP
jgi:Cytochrome c3